MLSDISAASKYKLAKEKVVAWFKSTRKIFLEKIGKQMRNGQGPQQS